MPKAEQIDQLVAMVKRAKRPLLLMGSQAMWPPVETAKLAKAVEVRQKPKRKYCIRGSNQTFLYLKSSYYFFLKIAFFV